MLINSAYYFIGCVFILEFQDHYRLVALHGGKVLVDASYETPKGARIAFARLYGYKAWSKEIKAEWSHFYDPDTRWLEKKTKDIKIVNSKHEIQNHVVPNKAKIQISNE